ncbi:antitoxin [Synergistales bacterium]|nr:antitoxin [Synergistales bacterium]GHV53914.1 antitoxin [Synergistales bacterium]
MYTTNLRRVGGSVMLAIPPALLESAGLAVGNEVGISIESERLMVEPRRRPRYTLDELLAQCDQNVSFSEEDREWIETPAAGRELI